MHDIPSQQEVGTPAVSSPVRLLTCGKAAHARPLAACQRIALTAAVAVSAQSMSLRSSICCRFAVLNDFEAIGYGVPVVPREDLVVLHDAPVSPKVTLLS